MKEPTTHLPCFGLMPEGIQFHQRLTGHQGAVYALCQGASDFDVYSAGGDGWMVHWDLRHPDPGKLIAKVTEQLFCLEFIPETRMLVAGNMHGGVHWVNLDLPDKTRNIQHHSKGTFAVVHKGAYLYSGGGEGSITRWDVMTSKPIDSLMVSNKSVRAITFHPKDDLLAVGCSDGHIYMVDIANWQVVGQIHNAHLPSVFSLAFNESGQYLWSGGRDATLRCWDIANASKLEVEIPAHWFTINALVVSPSQDLLVSGSRDKTIRFWDINEGTLLRTLEMVRDQGHRNSVNSLIWSPYENTLISASDDRTLIMWR